LFISPTGASDYSERFQDIYTFSESIWNIRKVGKIDCRKMQGQIIFIRRSFWQKDSLITHMIFELCLFMIFSPVANFRHHPLNQLWITISDQNLKLCDIVRYNVKWQFKINCAGKSSMKYFYFRNIFEVQSNCIIKQ
jgi:hypothetical protein